MTLYIQKRKYFFASIKMVWQFNFFPNLKYKYIKYHHFNLYIIIIQNTRIPDVFTHVHISQIQDSIFHRGVINHRSGS